MAEQSLDEILAQVNGARGDAADAIDQVNARLAELAALNSSSASRFAEMGQGYADLNQHLAEQSQRMIAVSGKLITAVAEGEAALTAFGSSQVAGFSALDARFGELDLNQGATQTAITGHAAMLDSRHLALDALANATRNLSDALTNQVQATLDTVGIEFESRMDDTAAQVDTHAAGLQQDLSELVETHFTAFADRLMGAVERTRVAVQDLQDSSDRTIDSEYTQLRGQLGQLEDKLAKTVKDLSNAIDKLENAATKAAGVLAEGGEAASKLMKASNIGLDQVFDFIRNLEKLVEEVIDAAS